MTDKMEHEKCPKVSIILLNWNGKEDTIECLESLKHITYPNYEILLVDNGSTDGSVKCVRSQYPGMEIIENWDNMGFAEGNNIGIRYAIQKLNPEYVMLLNNDTIVDKDFLNELIEVAKMNEQIGFIGPKIFYYDYNGRTDVINFTGENFNFWKGEAVKRCGLNEIDKGNYDEIEEFDRLDGACILIKKDVFQKTGLLDLKYFTYWEVTDLCIKSSKYGFKKYYAPRAKIWHKINTTSGGALGKYHVYYVARNRFSFMKKNANPLQLLVFLIYFFGYKFWLICSMHLFIHKNIKSFGYFINGVKDGVKALIF